MYRLQPIRWRRAELSSQKGGSRAAAHRDGEETEHVREAWKAGKVEVGRPRDAVLQCVCL